jgi:uncharacterized membrane protein
MDFITGFFGRFHPLLVHLPIGILFLAFLFECLSLKKSYRGLRKAIQPALLVGSIFAVAAAISGYFLRQEGGYEEDLADLHQNFGIATAALCLAVYVIRARLKYWVDDPLKRKQLRILLFLPLIILLSITGHWGGSLTHGEDYLFSAMSLDAQEPVNPVMKIRTISNVEEAVLYDHVIQPILEARCYDCHSSRKQKGELRLDKVEYIVRGGKNGEVISDGPPDSSSLYKRLVLPIEDDHHMPPGEKPQLSSSEIALIKYWIEEEANFEKPIRAFESHEKIAAIIRTLQEAPAESWIPDQPVDAANEKTLVKLNALGITPMPLAESNNHLMVTFTGFREITDEHISALQEISDQLVWLNLSHTPVTDEQLDGISKLRNLRVLFLNNTGISDAGLAKIAPLPELRSLSLVGTNVTDASIATFKKLESLTNLFLFQTTLTDKGISEFSGAHDEVNIDTGNYRLKELPTDTIVYKKVTVKN